MTSFSDSGPLTCHHEDLYEPRRKELVDSELKLLGPMPLIYSGCGDWAEKCRQGDSGVSRLCPVKCIWNFSVSKSKYFPNCSLSASTWDWKKSAVLWCFIDSNIDINQICLTQLLISKKWPISCKMLCTQLKKTNWKGLLEVLKFRKHLFFFKAGFIIFS